MSLIQLWGKKVAENVYSLQFHFCKHTHKTTEIRMTSKHMEICLILLVRGMQTKTDSSV